MKRKSPSSIEVYIGSKIRARRLALNLSQRALAAKVSVTGQQICKYECGLDLRVGRLVALAAALEVSPNYFFDMIDGIVAGDKRQQSRLGFLATPDGGELVDYFLKLPNDHSRRAMVAFLRSMALA